MVSVSHMNAAYYFERDVECLRLFFERRYGFVANSVPSLADCQVRRHQPPFSLSACRAFGTQPRRHDSFLMLDGRRVVGATWGRVAALSPLCLLPVLGWALKVLAGVDGVGGCRSGLWSWTSW